MTDTPQEHTPGPRDATEELIVQHIVVTAERDRLREEVEGLRVQLQPGAYEPRTSMLQRDEIHRLRELNAELLAALQAIHDAHSINEREPDEATWCDYDGFSFPCHTRTIAAAAIAKATGAQG